jgi:hypothetical protein
MAQKQDDEQAPRKTTTYNKFEGMASQNERYNVKQEEMFWIENIMRTGPRKLSSVPGPGFRSFFPSAIPCTDSTQRGQQSLTVITAFNQQGEAPGETPPSGNDRTSWAYVAPSGEVTALNGVGTCGGGNMTYGPTCCQLNHYVDNIPVVSDHPALIDVSSGGLAANTRVGIGDQPGYAYNDNSVGGGGLRIYYPDTNNHVDYLQPVSGGYTGYNVDAFCYKDNEAWLSVNQNAFSPSRHLNVFNRASGVFVADYSTLNGFYISNMNLTATNLICLAHDISNPDTWAIKIIDRLAGTLTNSIDLSNLNPLFLFAVNDNLIYILGGYGHPLIPASLYYWDGSNIVYVGVAVGFPTLPFTQGSGQFSGGRYYFGENGFAGFSVDIYSLAVACPGGSGPRVASITLGSSSVAAGATIDVTWHDVLEPNKLGTGGENDRIVLYPKPSAGNLDFLTSTALAEKVTTGATSSTITFTIPGGTTPGDYVFRYQVGQTAEGILVATSPAFTVT